MMGLLRWILARFGFSEAALMQSLVKKYLLGGAKGESLAGALPNLVNQFKNAGLGDLVNSWVAKGPNKLITGDQIQHAIGRDQLDAIAKKAGIPVEAVSAKLAEYLPKVVDKLTPGGQLPTGR